MNTIENTLSVNVPTLCLNMIVKNESKIITRLFDSVLPIIDCYCICDTGSTDNTVDVIKNYFKEKNIPGKVVCEPFKNFCHNRNYALQACVGLSDYVLLLDADMILEINSFKKTDLRSSDSFMILQGDNHFFYQNMRIIRNNGLYSYKGVTHEYIDVPHDNSTGILEKSKIFIKDIGDGGCKNDKFERDIKLLLDGIKEEPNNVRYYFYLANSYHDCGKYEEAIPIYRKRIELGAWREEVWYSYYRIGLCYKHLGKMPEAIYTWLEGYNFWQYRLEGIYEIMNYYRNNSKHMLCSEFYKIAKAILDKKDNRDQYLFLHNDVYTYKLHYEYSICAAYTGVSNINNELITIFNNCEDENIKNNTLSNMKFYKFILNKKSTYSFDNSRFFTINGKEIKFNASTSSLIKNPEEKCEYQLCIRYVNYNMTDKGGYNDCDENVISVYKFINLDTNFHFISEKYMDIVYDGKHYIGVEDIKIHYDNYNKKLIYIGNAQHNDNSIGVVWGDFNYSNGNIEVKELKCPFNNHYVEKNWVFVDYKNENHIIYNWYPLQICKMEEGVIKIVEKKPMPRIFSKVRGNSCGFVYSNKIDQPENNNILMRIEEVEYWFVTHIVSYESPRYYYHMISVFDSNMNLLRYSAPFKFEGEPTEYSLAIVVEDEQVLITYSTWDRTSRIAVYDKKYIDSILVYSP